MIGVPSQLLTFFSLTLTPRPTQGQPAINLPKLDASTEPPPMVDPFDEKKKDEYTITLNSAADGGVANISMKGPTGASPDIKNTAELLYQLEKITPPAGRKR